MAPCKLLVDNMHCPSCVRHIEDLLAEYDLRNVAVSLFAGTVAFDHDHDFDLRRIVRALEHSGFRPFLPEKQASPGEGRESQSHPHRSSAGSHWLASLLPAKRQQRRRHRAVCEACQHEEEDLLESKNADEASTSPKSWTKSVFSVEGMTCGCAPLGFRVACGADPS
jgi:copper chaperone CopZ